jgi:hypothetical protein
LPSGRVVPAPELMAVTDLMGRAGFRLNRFKVISGRLAHRRAPDEAVTDFLTADREDLRVGSIIKFVVGSPDAKPAGLASVRIVGIVASPGQFPAVGASPAFGGVYVTPCFWSQSPEQEDQPTHGSPTRGPAEKAARGVNAQDEHTDGGPVSITRA